MKKGFLVPIVFFYLHISFSGDLRAQETSENNDSVEAADLYSRAAYLFSQEKYSEANDLALESLQLSSGLSDSRAELPVLRLLADMRMHSGLQREALPFYIRSYTIYDEIRDTAGLVYTATEIAGNYYQLKAYEKAGEYYRSALNLVSPKEFSRRASYLEDLGFCALYSGNPDSAVTTFTRMRQLMIVADIDDSKALYYLAKSCDEAQRFSESMGYNQELFDRYAKIPDYQKMSALKNNLAYNLTLLKRYPEAAEEYKEAIQYGDQAGNNLVDQAALITNRGVCLQNNGQWRPAVSSFREAINKYQDANDFSEKARVENMVSQVYFSRRDLYNAGLFSKESVESARIAKDPVQLAESCLTYSKMLREGNDPIMALEYYEEYLRLRDSIQFENRMQEEKLSGMKSELEKSEKELNLKIRDDQVKKLSIRQLSLQLEKEEQEKALMMREKEVDKLEKESMHQAMEIGNQRHAAEQSAREKQILKQENRIKDLQLEQNAKDQEAQQQKITLLETQKERDKLMAEKQKAASRAKNIIIVLMVLAGLSILANLYTTRRKNQLLAKQKKEIQEQNSDLEQKNDEIGAQRDEIESQRDLLFEQKGEIEQINTEITKSIEYARKIQASIIPKPEDLAALTRESFVFFRPRDIVSGDFYWFASVENTTIITVADCTGHGVPGAIMSMLGMSLLKEIVLKEYITQPAVILRKLRKEIINALGQKGISGEQRDGMDIALIAIHQDTRQIEYAGAFNPLYVIRESHRAVLNAESEVVVEDEKFKLHILQADKMPVAHYDRMDKFTNYEFQCEEGDQLYLFTDGFADQFGGPNGKKFMYKPFMNLLLENASHSMEKQGEILNSTFMEWRSEVDQTDDVCVVGLKI